MKLRHLRYFVLQAFGSIAKTPLVQLIAVSTITVSLTVLCSLFALTTNLDDALQRWNRGLGVIIFLKSDVTDSRVSDLAHQIGLWPSIESVTVHDRKKARDELKKTLANDDLGEHIDDEILPVSIELALKENYRTEVGRAQLAKRLDDMAETDQVRSIDFGSDLMTRMTRVSELVSVGSLVIGLLTLFAVVFIITNTVRLTLFARKEEIEIMELVGATHLFIRIPFYLEGAFQGVVGAGFALGITWSIIRAIPKTGILSGVAQSAPELSFLSPGMVTLVVLSAALMGIGASHLATGRFLGYGRGS